MMAIFTHFGRSGHNYEDRKLNYQLVIFYKPEVVFSTMLEF